VKYKKWRNDKTALSLNAIKIIYNQISLLTGMRCPQ
jgi:hypothetical protein